MNFRASPTSSAWPWVVESCLLKRGNKGNVESSRMASDPIRQEDICGATLGAWKMTRKMTGKALPRRLYTRSVIMVAERVTAPARRRRRRLPSPRAAPAVAYRLGPCRYCPPPPSVPFLRLPLYSAASHQLAK